MVETSIVCVVPTRNRAALAGAAVRSIVAQAPSNVRVIVSDNSTDSAESDRLADFCASFDARVVRYVRPPEPLAMSAHWSWALSEALANADTSHVLFLTDRMVFRRGELVTLGKIAAMYPGKVITYNHDVVHDERQPIHLTLYPWTDRLFDLSSRRLLWISSRGMIHWSLPRMLNCLVPRTVFEAIQARFGGVFGSIAPDFHFAFRCLDVVDSVLYLDRSPLVAHSIGRSNGASYARGLFTRDRVDFDRSLGSTQMNSAAPVPEFQTVRNVIFNEYSLVRREAQSDKFPPIDTRAYLAAVLEDLSQLEDSRVRSAMIDVLGDTGWVAGPRARLDAALAGLRLAFVGWDVLRFIGQSLGRARITPGGLPEQALKVLGIQTSPKYLQFRSTSEALDLADGVRGPRVTNYAHLAALDGPNAPLVPLDVMADTLRS